jgi:acyl dehydratase
MRFFEDIQVGQRREIGSFTFTADGIKAFAAKFDPQAFHLDEEAGRKSLFGGLGMACRVGLHETPGGGWPA